MPEKAEAEVEKGGETHSQELLSCGHACQPSAEHRQEPVAGNEDQYKLY